MNCCFILQLFKSVKSIAKHLCNLFITLQSEIKYTDRKIKSKLNDLLCPKCGYTNPVEFQLELYCPGYYLLRTNL